MPELDQVLAPRPPGPSSVEVVEGELVDRGGALFARVDDRPALWGPLVDGTDGRASSGATALIAVAQTGRPWVLGVE